MKKIIIAIDGHSSCGKSTLAKDLAKTLGLSYISTGKMYRAVTLFFLEHKIDLNDTDAVAKALKKVDIHFEDGGEATFLNGKLVEERLADPDVANNVSQVAALALVRKELVRQQQAIGASGGVVMDGRDIGTVVFPRSGLKIFLTAHPEIRAKRRYQELRQKGLDIDFDAVQHNIEERDRIDSSRQHSPLRKAVDAVLVDNSNLSRTEQLAMVKALALVRTET